MTPTLHHRLSPSLEDRLPPDKTCSQTQLACNLADSDRRPYCYGLPWPSSQGTRHACQAVFLRKPWLTSMFNAGQMAISLGLADLAFQQVRCVTPHTITCKIVALVLAMVVFDLCNVTLVSIAVPRERKQEWQECFWQMAIARRRSPLPFMYLLSLTGALLCSFIGKGALLISFAHMVAVFYLMRFQRELDIRTEESRTDPLTKAKNYRYLEDWLHSEFPKLVAAKRRVLSCSLT